MVRQCDIHLFMFQKTSQKSTPLIETYLVIWPEFYWLEWTDLHLECWLDNIKRAEPLGRDTFLGVIIRHIIMIHAHIFLVNHNPQIPQKQKI